jgi:hypothetical protein
MTDMSKLRFKKLSATTIAPHTQKARGLWVISAFDSLGYKTASCYLGFLSDNETEGLPYTDPIVEKLWSGTVSEWFARGCPSRPRHGFTDSCKVRSLEELQAVYKKALAEDAEAEVLLMPFLKCNYSALYVPESGSLTVAQGHDGATSGVNTFNIPVAPSEVPETFRERAAIAKDEHTYLELIYNSNKMYQARAFETTLVQARSGPPVQGGVSEYVPRRMEIKSVLEPELKDLIAHEQLCVALAGADGVVFWQPRGSMTSHPAVHCSLNGIAYLTRTERPEPGQWIDPPVVEEAGFNWYEFTKGIKLSETADTADNLITAIGIMHNIASLKYSPHYSRLIGYAVGWIFRASAMACLGESRHYKGKQGALGSKSREGVYQKAGTLTNAELCKKLATFSYKFMHTSWSSSYGGYNWYAASVQTIKLWNYLSTMRHAEAASEANKLLTMAHNGGWLFNKFASQGVMNDAANDSGRFLSKHGPRLYELLADTTEVLTPIKPRMYRSSAKWSVSLLKSKGLEVQFKIQNIHWRSIYLSDETLQTMLDTFEHV